jgi:hypothetical protein
MNGKVYFRTDDESRADYPQRGMPALQPRHRQRGPRTVDRNFEVPPDVLENAVTLCDWAMRAVKAKR